MRARDLDRSDTASVLDAAYAEGQLGADEYHDRVAKAKAATTIGDLTALTADLQTPAALGARAPRVVSTSPKRARPSRQGWYSAALTAAALVVAFGAFALTSGDDEPAPAAPPAAAVPEAEPAAPRAELDDVDPVIIETPDLVTGAGLAHFIADFRAEFGDTIADEISLHPDHGDVERAVPGQPNRLVTYDYRGGFQRPSEPTTRKVDTPTVDLGALDTTAVGAALANAGTIAQVPDGKVSHLSVEIYRFGSSEGQMVVWVYVGNEFDESGHFVLDPAGEVLRVWPFEG